MKAWRWLGACLVLVALAVGASVHGQGGEKKGKGKGEDPKKGKEEKKGGKEKPGPEATGDKLEWKAFGKEGDKFYQEMVTKTEQKMKVMTMEVTQKQNQTFYVEWATQKVTDKEYVVKQTILGVKMDIEIGGNKISYDSTNLKDQQNNPLTEFFKALVGQSFTLTIDRSKLTASVDEKDREKFIENLSRANPQLKQLLNAILSRRALEQMADPVFSAIPEGGVIPEKKTWKKESVLEMGPIGKYTTNYDFTFKGTNKEGIATIDVDTKLKYEPPGADAKDKEALPFKIVGATLESKKGHGEVKFSTKEGRIQSSEMSMVLAGVLDIEIAGQTTNVTLEQNQTSSLKTLDKNPIQTAPK
jgi:hypothetical protein